MKSRQDKADAIVTSPCALSANVRKGADVLSELLDEDSRETRMGLSAAARKAAKHAAKLSGPRLLEACTARALRDNAHTAALVHGWNKGEGQGVSISLNVLSLPMIETRE